MEFGEMTKLMEKIRLNVTKVMVGQDKTVDLVLVALLAKGHVLLEDVPGTGKTVMAKALAKSVKGIFSRIQFTPDILPMDIIGANIFNQRDVAFEFRRGPVFGNIILADEINRATPRTQSALLECMEERQITVDGVTYPLDSPFMVVATQNPIETQGTFPLPEAQLDRFLIKTKMVYLSNEDAVAVLDRFISSDPLALLDSVVTVQEITEAQQKLPQVQVSEVIRRYIVELVDKTRKGEDVLLGVSPRGALALMRSAQAYAILKGRDYVLPDDVKAMAPAVLCHRIVCRSAFAGNAPQVKVVEQALAQVAVPTESVEEGR